MASEEKYLWLFHYQLHDVNRLWWAYFPDWAEVQACIAKLMGALPCLVLQEVAICRDGLRILDHFYSFTSSNQEQADAWFAEMARQRDKQFFPLAPSACGYLE